MYGYFFLFGSYKRERERNTNYEILNSSMMKPVLVLGRLNTEQSEKVQSLETLCSLF